MMPSEFKKQLQKTSWKVSNKKNISNSLLTSFIKNNNTIALKIILYIAKIELKNYNKNEKILTIRIPAKNLLKHTNTTHKTLKRNLINLQKTSIKFVDYENKDIIEYISLLPRVKFLNENTIEIDIYTKVLNLIWNVKKYFTNINLDELLELKNKNSIKLFMLLKYLQNFNFTSRKSYELAELNEFFGTNYKSYTHFKKNVLDKAVDELKEKYNLNIQITPLQNYDTIGKGRKKINSILIEI